MGNSAKRKKEKQKDFVKPKLKVGKAKGKPENFTDTSFKSKGITLTQQSLTLNAPTTSTQFSHHLSLLSSKSDSQRRDSLAHLTTSISARPVDSPLPKPVSLILPSLYPLLLDPNSGVRTNLLKLLKVLPEGDVIDHVGAFMPYVRAGMTHLAADVRVSSVEVLSWLISVGGEDVVSVAGGWVKTLNCFLSVLGWHLQGSNSKWTTLSTSAGAGASSTSTSSGTSSGNKASYGKAGAKGRPQVRFLSVLGEFLDAGIGSPISVSDVSDDDEMDTTGSGSGFPISTLSSHLIPSSIASPYITLNVFGAPRDEEGEMYETRVDRWRVFVSRGFLEAVEKGVEGARAEGGEVGRASVGVWKVLSEAKGVANGGDL
ncbi:IPI1/TEX10 family protein [Aspergillus stella-maris]|uniref:IPI1/TEX10 family protein n=1 Tax=Aspergillus stella-maris TaxID=1810926 RepID=UPI003CCD0DC3